MTIEEMHIAFKLLVDKNDTSSTQNFLPEEVDFYLNLAIVELSKTKYTGTNVKHEGFEQTEKRKNDLRNLITKRQIGNGGKDSVYNTHRLFSLPQDYWFPVSELVTVCAKSCTSSLSQGTILTTGTSYILTTGTCYYHGRTYIAPDIIVGNGTGLTSISGTLYLGIFLDAFVLPTTQDKINNAKRDPFNKPSIDKVLRLTRNNYSEIVGTNEIIPYIYNLTYFRRPGTVSLENEIDCDLSDLIHDEIVRVAVQMALEPMRSERYNTMQNEIIKQE